MQSTDTQLNLSGKMVAVLIDEGFAAEEMLMARRVLDQAGAVTHLIALNAGRIACSHNGQMGSETYPVDVPISQAHIERYDMLLLPGNPLHPTALANAGAARTFISEFFDMNKTVGVWGWGAALLAHMGLLHGRRLAAPADLRTAIESAGGQWTEKEAVIDNNLISGRTHEDMPVFSRELLLALSGQAGLQHALNIGLSRAEKH